jgi:predicted kinase
VGTASRAYLVLLIGPPGVGKSVMGSRLATRLDAALVQTDAIRKRLFMQPTYSVPENAAVFREAHRLIKSSLESGEPVVFDATNLREANRRHVYRIAERAGAFVLPVWLAAAESVIAQRLWQRQVARDPDDESDATWAIYRRMASRGQPPLRPFIVVNSTLPADEQVSVLERVVESHAQR